MELDQRPAIVADEVGNRLNGRNVRKASIKQKVVVERDKADVLELAQSSVDQRKRLSGYSS